MEYTIRQKIVSIKDKFAVLDAYGNPAFYVRTKLFTFPKKMWLDNAAQQPIIDLKWHFTFMFAKIDLINNGEVIATVKRKFSPFRPKYVITTRDFGDMVLQGSVFEFSFKIRQGDNVVGEISKKIARIADTYVVRSYVDQLDAILISIALIIDVLHHPNK